VATHFNSLLGHAWVTVGLFLFPGYHTGNILHIITLIIFGDVYKLRSSSLCCPFQPPAVPFLLGRNVLLSTCSQNIQDLCPFLNIH